MPGNPRVLTLHVTLAVALVLLTTLVSAQDKEYSVRGMVLRVDRANRSFVVSHETIAGLMDSMTMPFDVKEAKELDAVVPGAIVEFTLVVGERSAYATRMLVKRYESAEQDPLTARRLALLKRVAGTATAPVAIGQQVPEFSLIDQAGSRVALSGLLGKVVAVNFIYTRCALPQFCLRVSNNFGVLRKRFERQLGRDLVLLTVTFDPERDTPEVLGKYASQWQADAKTWHFLTGAVRDVRRVCAMFGVESFPDEGLMNHSLHTAIIDTTGKLVANIEGNQFTPEQLVDLVRVTIEASR